MDTYLMMQLPPTAINVTDIPSCEQRQFRNVERAADEALVAVLVEDFAGFDLALDEDES